MLPTPKEFTERKQEQKFASLISICIPDTKKSIQILREKIPKHLPGKSIAKITNEEKEKIIDAISLAFDDAFVGGISVPMDALCVKNTSLLKTTYSTALGMMLIPLLRMHADAYISEISIRIPEFGGNDYGGLGRTKELIKAMGYGKGSDVELFSSSQRDLWLCFRFIYWAAYKSHNRDDSADLVELEKKLSTIVDGAGT